MSRPSQPLLGNPNASRRRTPGVTVPGVHDRRPMMGVEAIDEEESEDQPKPSIAGEDTHKKWADLDEPDDDEDPFGVMASEMGDVGPVSSQAALNNPELVGSATAVGQNDHEGAYTTLPSTTAAGTFGTMLNEVLHHGTKRW